MTLGDGGGFELWRDPAPASRPCAFCRQQVESDPAISCNRCGTIYHPDCWKANNRRCAVYGCAPVSPPPPPAPPPPPLPRVRRERIAVPEPARFGSGLGRWSFLGVIVLVNVIRIFARTSTSTSSNVRPPQIDYTSFSQRGKPVDVGEKNRKLSDLLLMMIDEPGKRRNLDESLKYANQAVQLDPSYARAWHLRGDVRVDRGELEAAVSDYTRAVELDRADLRALYDRGCALYDLQRWEECAKDFARTYQGSPSMRTPSQLRFALARAHLDQRAAAEKDLAEFLAKSDSVDPWQRELLRFVARLSDEEILFAAAEQVPGKWGCQAYYYAGELRLLDNDPEQAKVYFTRCQEIGSKADRECASAAARLRAPEKK